MLFVHQYSPSISNSENKKNKIALTLFRMGIFGAARGWVVPPSLKSVTHILE